MGYIYLAIAIFFEVVATSALKASDGFTKMTPNIIMCVCYFISFLFLAQVVRTIPVGVSYAIWSGMGIVLIALVGAFLFNQIPDLAAIIGMSLIVAGVAVIYLLSDMQA